MADNEEILEGFLCPMCKQNFDTGGQLSAHFQLKHEHQDALKSFMKGALEKAKKTFKKSNYDSFANELGHSLNSEISSDNHAIEFESQELGMTRTHSDYFRNVRSTRLERCTAETNKLLIRLGKLLVDLPLDPLRRKSHEQSVVPWIDDRDVKLCPSCAKSFHVARRKHHCRLCGTIMCHDCTHFLDLTVAKKLVSPGFGTEEATASSSNCSSPMLSVTGHSGSSNSLNSVLSFVDTVAGDQNLRLCVHCKQLLETREKLQEYRSWKPIICQFYERLLSYISEADHLCELFSNVCQSFNCGERKYDLSEAQVIRSKLLKLAENIDSLSKKIVILGTKDVENPPRGKALQLQQMIRMAAACYLKEKFFGLPSLPSEVK